MTADSLCGPPTEESRRSSRRRTLYALYQSVDDPRRFAFVERWESREKIDAHLASDHIKKFVGKVPDLSGDSAGIVLYEALPGGGGPKGSLAEHAGSAS